MPLSLNWSAAEVADLKLTVALDGEMPSGWKQSFESTVRLLGGGEWGKVRVKKQTVQVSDLTPGTEEKLRHFLESAVVQANAAHLTAGSDAGADTSGRGAGENDGPDAQMTERFRAFVDRAAE